MMQSDFFITYILTNGMSGFSLEVLQFGLLIWQFLKAHSLGHSEEPYLYGFPYFRVVPIVSVAILIGVVYAVVAPLLLPILLIYFLLGYAVYGVHQPGQFTRSIVVQLSVSLEFSVSHSKVQSSISKK
jgi:hypothetical protein